MPESRRAVLICNEGKWHGPFKRRSRRLHSRSLLEPYVDCSCGSIVDKSASPVSVNQGVTSWRTNLVDLAELPIIVSARAVRAFKVNQNLATGIVSRIAGTGNEPYHRLLDSSSV
jgi:hypothetical protein